MNKISTISLLLPICAAFLGAPAYSGEAKLDIHLIRALGESPGIRHPILIRLRDERKFKSLDMTDGKDQGRHVVSQLREISERSQRSIRGWLKTQGIAARSYWLGNQLRIEADKVLVDALSQRVDVKNILLDRPWKRRLPKTELDRKGANDPAAVEASLAHIGVPLVWATGITGQTIVIGGQDTGYQWDHPALKASYRGWDGVNANHDYNWHDAIHELIGLGPNSCGINLQAPCDDDNHGTHTMGTMVGDDGNVNQIGVAPGARWIGCRSLEENAGTPSTYTECFQWLMAPTTLDGSNPDPEKAPHIINNSWYCSESEGCTPSEIALMEDVVESVRAAGILVVTIAGNSGPACGTVDTPPGMYDASLTIGATAATSDVIAGFSSRGPVPGGLLKPDLVAPGVSIRSSVSGNGYAPYSGTSMAAPHVAGVAALLMSVNPSLRGNPDAVESILLQTAAPLTSGQNCGEFPGQVVPNAVFGYGRVDAWAAFRVAEAIFLNDFEE